MTSFYALLCGNEHRVVDTASEAWDVACSMGLLHDLVIVVAVDAGNGKRACKAIDIDRLGMRDESVIHLIVERINLEKKLGVQL